MTSVATDAFHAVDRVRSWTRDCAGQSSRIVSVQRSKIGQASAPVPNIVSEMALAHKVSDKVEAAYRRRELLEKEGQLNAGLGHLRYKRPEQSRE